MTSPSSPGPSSSDNDRIEALKKRLDSSNPPSQSNFRHSLHRSSRSSEIKDTSDHWQSDKKNTNFSDENLAATYTPIFKRVFLFALIFFLVALSIAAIVFIRGSNVVSPSNIDIAFQGPVSTPAGQALPIDITLTNANPTDLLLADLVVTYPEGARQSEDMITPLISERVPVGTLASGQAYHLSIKPVLYGQENTQQVVKVSFEYRIPGSTAIFVKDKEYPIFIGASPLVVNIDTVKEVIANQSVQFDISIKSNSTEVIKNIILKTEYPFGFQYESSTPDPAGDKTTWNIGDISPGDTRHVILKGKLSGQDGEERIFRFSLGLADPNNPSVINGLITSLSQPIAIKQPFLAVDVSLDNDASATHVVQGGEMIRGQISWQNNLTVPINDVVLKLKLTGDILSRTNVSADNGFFRSIDNTILWDKTTVKDLSSVPPQSGGTLQFTLATVDPSVKNNAYYRKPTIAINATVEGNRLSDNNVPEVINSTISKTIKVLSAPRVVARLVRSVGPFVNTGPLPPQAEQESTYTVIWTVSNSFNTVNGTVVTATLPNYVTWLGKTSPTGSDVTYNPEKHQVIWNIGDLPAGLGYASASREADFQVSLLPSVSQIDTLPIVVNPTELSGTDNFTGTNVQYTGFALDTKISTDPAFVFGQEKVSK